MINKNEVEGKAASDGVQDLSSLELLCAEKNMRMTDQRRVIARVLSEAKDHPSVEDVYSRAHEVDDRISLSI